MNIVINALPYKKNSSGIGTMIRELYGAYAGVTLRKCQIIMPHDSPEFSTGGQCELIRMPWNYDQGFRRILFQAFAMGRRCCRNAVLLTTDSKCPFFLPKSCTSIPLITHLAVYRMPEVYPRSRVFLWRLQYCYVRQRAFDGLKERGGIPHQLVVAGEQGWKFDRENALGRLKHREAVRFVGFVPDEDMPALYSAANLFAFPTLYEGFGIPVLEPQSCGVPVLASDCSTLPEVGARARCM